MSAGIGERVQYSAARSEEKRAKQKEKTAKLRLKIKRDEEKIKDYKAKMEYIEERHLGRLKEKSDHISSKINDLRQMDIDARVRGGADANIRAAKREEVKAKREKKIARLKIKQAHISDKMKYYVARIEAIEERHIARLKRRIAKHNNQIRDLEHISKW